MLGIIGAGNMASALARRADTIILGHKPHQLQEIAGQIDAAGKQVFSVLGPTNRLSQPYHG